MAKMNAFTQELEALDSHIIKAPGSDKALADTSRALTMVERLVLALDNSGSMGSSMDPEDWRTGKSKLDATKDAVLTMLANSDAARTHYGVVSFESDARVVNQPHYDYDAIAPSIMNIDCGGGTDMAGGLALSLRLRPHRIVMLSDGHPNNSEAALSEARRAATAGIKIDTISVGDANDELMQEIARLTGGKWSRVTDLESMKKTFLNLETRKYLALEDKTNA